MKIYLIIIFVIVLVVIINMTQNRPVKFTSNDIIYKSYSVNGYEDLKNKSGFLYTIGSIPKIIIKTSWQTRDKFPLQMIDSLDKTIDTNPDWGIYYFDDDEVDQFMKDFSNEYSKIIYNDIYGLYKKLVPGAFKADFFRVCCLYKYGGCYSDIGHICLTSLNDVCGDSNLVLVSDTNEKGFHGIHNAFMCSTIKHEFFKTVIYHICYNIDNEFYGESCLDITGPERLGKIFNCFFLYKCNDKLENLFVYGAKIYSCDKCNVKILNFKAKNGVPDKILDGDKEIIDCKFKDYYNVMYKNQKTPRYGELWDTRKVYN